MRGTGRGATVAGSSAAVALALLAACAGRPDDRGPAAAGTSVSARTSMTPAAVSAPTPSPPSRPTTSPPPPPTTVHVRSTIGGIADYPQYENLAELGRASTLVVTGRIVAAGRSIQEPDHPKTPANKVGSGFVSTPLTLQIDQVIIHRSGPAPGQRITVNTEGGIVGDRMFTVFGGAILAVSGEYMLFLRRFETADPGGVYAVVGGGQGSYVITGSHHARAIPETGAASGVVRDVDGKSLAELIDDVRGVS